MPKQLLLQASVELPDDVFEASKIVILCGGTWSDLLTRLKTDGVKHEAKSEVIEVRAQREPKPRKQRAKKDPTIPPELMRDPAPRPLTSEATKAAAETLV